MADSFMAALSRYKKTDLSSDNQAHLQRWADDPRAEEVWQTITRVSQKNKKVVSAQYLIVEILGARRVAMAIGQRRKYREAYRKKADEMVRLAKFLRRPDPVGMPPYPPGMKLAQMLDDAAGYFRRKVELTRNIPDVVKFSRKSKPRMIFLSMVGNDLKQITGSWLDEQVGVLAEIAFDAPDVIDAEVARQARRQPRKRVRMPARN
jgi:hypothetical protein